MAEKAKHPQIYLFTDGSHLSDHTGAWAVVSVQISDGNIDSVRRASGFLPHSSSLLAELLAANQALRMLSPGDSALLISDNQTVVQALQPLVIRRTEPTISSAHDLWERKLREEYAFLRASGCQIKSKWVKAHQPLCALPPNPSLNAILRWGNSQADNLATKTAKSAGHACEVVELL